MSESAAALPWLVVRQDANGNRYRVGRYATRAEAQSMVERLGRGGTGSGAGADGASGGAEERRYLVERLRRGNGDQA
ncbi:SPOR domain-containing protein [Streptomyces sp. TRM43335]|uniref:SPOR domain-containing protein n=1 Tax=Streptomyces taklimakanensis TaxID=2569853 RepID=A0A6G2BFI8_9ACTN|nr:SPOR domain-containing protein [Streptomyces taklimakanensis]MTE20823.1 SPOR domain-containing protein [Streptomyces taklimakanensis]